MNFLTYSGSFGIILTCLLFFYNSSSITSSSSEPSYSFLYFTEFLVNFFPLATGSSSSLISFFFSSSISLLDFSLSDESLTLLLLVVSFVFGCFTSQNSSFYQFSFFLDLLLIIRCPLFLFLLIYIKTFTSHFSNLLDGFSIYSSQSFAIFLYCFKN